MSDLKLIRCRAGFYVTKDAQWRIVRRQYLVKTVKLWYVEQWNPVDRSYQTVGRRSSLSEARAQLARLLAPIVEES